MNTDKQLDISFLLGIFTSTALIWLYVYQFTIELTTAEPAALSLIYLGIGHYLSFLCVVMSFILMIRYALIHGIDSNEVAQYEKFIKFSDKCQKFLFLMWAPMFIYVIISLLLVGFISEGRTSSNKEPVIFIIGIAICALFFLWGLKLNIFKFIFKFKSRNIIILFMLAFPYMLLLSEFSAGVKIVVERQFYQEDEIVRFQVIRKGYIYLPNIKLVDYNLRIYEPLKEYTDFTYYINLIKYKEDHRSLIEVEYETQVFQTIRRSYSYLGVTP